MPDSPSVAPHRRSSSFFLPMLCMPSRKRRHGLKALYYFCRVVDDAIDDAPSPLRAQENLAFWQKELAAIYDASLPPPTHPVSRQLQRDAVEVFALPRLYFDDLMAGMAFDCQPQPVIADEAALEKYCYQVAGTVGLLALPVFGVSGSRAEEYARHLGLALQLTNILRDTHADGAKGRRYLPVEWGQEARRKTFIKTSYHYQISRQLEYDLPFFKLLPARLMRVVYYRKFQQNLKSAGKNL